VLTLGVSYVISLISAANNRHTTAARINGLGRTPADVILAAWNGRDLHQIEGVLRGLIGPIARIAQQHLAYPVLRHFHATEPTIALGARLAALDEALTLTDCAVVPGRGPSPVTTAQLRSAVDRILALERRHVGTTDASPPPGPDLAPLRAAGVPVVDDQAFHDAVGRLGARRVALRRLVEDDGWTWADVAGRR
jgi:hypothetical protein